MAPQCILSMFVHKILNYEPGLYDMIYNDVIYIFKNNKELKIAVELWCAIPYNANKYGHISLWNTFAITDMGGLFSNKSKFNDNINNWDVSNVISMENMFKKCSYNQPLNNWDVKKVTNMRGMFSYCSYNQPLSGMFQTLPIWNGCLICLLIINR